MSPRISISFMRMNDSRLATKVQHIFDRLTNNVNFPDAGTATADARKTFGEYGSALSASEKGDDSSRRLKNEKKAELLQLLFVLAAYITSAAKGNASIMASSGFDLIKERGSRKSQDDLTFETGKVPGQVAITAKAVKGATSYIHQYASEPLSDASIWISVPSGSRKYKFTGLVPGNKYWFRVVAVGPKGLEVYSVAVPKIVQ